MALHRTPALPYCAAVYRVSALIAAFEIAVGGVPEVPAEACTGRRVHDAAAAGRDEMRECELGRQHRSRQVDPHGRLPDLGIHVTTFRSRVAARWVAAALLCKMSRPSEQATACFTSVLTDSGSPMSAGTAWASPPLLDRSGFRHARRRRHQGQQPPPLHPRARAQSRTARPMPDARPVTIADLAFQAPVHGSSYIDRAGHSRL